MEVKNSKSKPDMKPRILQKKKMETTQVKVVAEVKDEPPAPPVCVDKFTDTELDYVAVLESGEDMGVWADMFKCVQCPRVYTDKEFYNLHVKEDHNKERQAGYICDFCNKRFPSFNRMTMHMYVRHKHGMPYACTACSSSFRTRRAFKKHKRMNHAAQTSPSLPRRRSLPLPAHSRRRTRVRPDFHARLTTLLISSDIAEKIARGEVKVGHGVYASRQANAEPTWTEMRDRQHGFNMTFPAYE